jgi:hypothetical protein
MLSSYVDRAPALAGKVEYMWNVGLDNVSIVGDVVPVGLAGFTVD